jgi:2-isopropylmalate synthase
MAMRTRSAYFDVSTGIDTTLLYSTACLVSKITGMPIPRNKAVVGENAFSHESGIHQHAMLKHSSTYEILRPEDVGHTRSQLVLGKHSGRHALRDRLKKMGFQLDEHGLERIFGDFKRLAGDRKEISDSDIHDLVNRALLTSSS